MKNNKEEIQKVFRFRLRINDDDLQAKQKRTYLSDYFSILFLVSSFVFISLCFLFFVIKHYSLIEMAKGLLHGDEIAKGYFAFNILVSAVAGIYAMANYVYPVSKRVIDSSSKNFYFEDSIEANIEFHKTQKRKDNTLYKTGLNLVPEKDCYKYLNLGLFKLKRKKGDIFNPIYLNKNATNLSKLILGIAGSGKSAFLFYLYQAELERGTKLIIHAPDDGPRNIIVKSGYTYAISAPWCEDSVFIDIFKTLDVEDLNQQNALIDVVITSVHGYVDQSSDNAFFENGAVYILTASLRKVVRLARKNKTTSNLDEWINELVSKTQIYQFKELVDIYYPEASFTISEDAEKMTASIIASITKSLTNLGTLNNFYKRNRKPFDLRKWCLDIPEVDKKGNPLPEKQVIVLCSDKEYAEVSKINIALFVNMASVFLLSNEREKTFKKNCVRVHQVLDEFPNFAKNIDMNKWIEIINEGRKFGNIATVAGQNSHQITSCLKGNKVDSQKFLGSFHTQIIAQASPEDGDFIKNICGEVSYIDNEASSSWTDSGDGKRKKTISYSKKPVIEEITWQKIQDNLGLVRQITGKDSSKEIGVYVAIRLFETKLTANLFFPFCENFCENRRNEMLNNGTIIKNKEGLETYIYKDEFNRTIKQPLFFKERRITLTDEEQESIYRAREIQTKSNLIGKLAERKDLIGVKKAKEELAKLQEEEKLANTKSSDDVAKIIPTDEANKRQEDKQEKEEKAEGFAEATSEILKETALHGIDHTGTLGAIDNALTALDALLEKPEGEEQDQLVIKESSDNKKKRKIIRKKENERWLAIAM